MSADSLITDALQRLADSDSFAVIAFLAAQPDAITTADTYHQLARRLYYEERDLPAAISMSRAGAQTVLVAAATESDSARAADLKGRAKAFTYNLASYAWPGWDEPGITVTASDRATGLDAARANLRLARELDRDDLPLSRAWWILGAHQLAARDYAEAHTAFQHAADHARAAGEEGEALLAEAFGALVDVLQGGADQALAGILARLADQEHGDFFVDQVNTARRVFAAEP